MLPQKNDPRKGLMFLCIVQFIFIQSLSSFKIQLNENKNDCSFNLALLKSIDNQHRYTCIVLRHQYLHCLFNEPLITDVTVRTKNRTGR